MSQVLTATRYGNLPTNIINWDNTKKAIDFILNKLIDDWYTVLPIMWSWSIVASIRNCSMLDVCFSDMLLDYKHVAEPTGPLRRTLLLALRKGTGKERFFY
jgi:hypothetical protein